MPTWNNEDGLLVRFAKDNGAAVRVDGSKEHDGRVAVFSIGDATALGDTDTAAATGEDTYIPAGAVITEAYTIVDTAFTSGGAAVLDLGFKQLAGTNIDDDGIDAAVAVGALTANAVIAGDGALVGTKLANDSYFMATYDTAAFTAGAARVIVKYFLD